MGTASWRFFQAREAYLLLKFSRINLQCNNKESVVYQLPINPTREDVLLFLSSASSYGNLGAFVGAGFSKAVLNANGDGIALSWGELLERVSAVIGVDYATIPKEGLGYPEIASKICEVYSRNVGIKYSEALSKIKHEIASLTSWYPDKEQRNKYSHYFNTLSLSWVITTNYDLVIESLMTGASVPLGPNDSLISPKNTVPVYHLHGVRTFPEDIIIAQEDYVGLFRPSEYRQIKLALMIKESTMIILGYGLGDVNVLTALDWSRNVFKGTPENYPNEIIQIVRSEDPAPQPYRDRNSVIILETESLEIFFNEYSHVRGIALNHEDERKDALMELARKLDDADDSMVGRFIDDITFRAEVLRILGSFSNDLISGFVSFLYKCLDEAWKRAAHNGAFQAYADNLSMILDILTNFSIKQIPPALFETAAYALQRVGYFVGREYGKSYAAQTVWDARKNSLSPELVKELNDFSEQYDYRNIKLLCAQIP